jgi:hypothetical protein
MTRRRRLRRRLLWAGVLLGLVLVVATASTLRLALWARDHLVAAAGRIRFAPPIRKENTMHSRTSFVVVAAVAALVLAAPASADRWGADRRDDASASAPDWFERSAAVAIQKHQQDMLNARERGLGITDNQASVDTRSEGLNRLYGLGEYANPIDRGERALVESSKATEPVSGSHARSNALNRIHGLGEYARPIIADDRVRLDPTTVSESPTVSGSGREIEWPQIGIGLGLGIALALGLLLALRMPHVRPPVAR